MNWTGGHLSRHARNSKSSLTQRQKQHFAKARNNLLNGSQKRSPIRRTLFEKVEKPAWRDDLRLHPIAHHNQNDKVKTGRNIQGRASKIEGLEIIPEFSVPEAILQVDDNLHESWPSSHAEKGKNESLMHEELGSPVAICEANSLEERRRKILQRIDWVGANFQRPIRLKFTISGNSERLAKRRRINARHENQIYAATQPIVMSPLAKTRPKQKLQSSSNNHNAHGKENRAFPKNNVRISIGGRHVAVGTVSSSGQGKIVGGRLASSQASTSEEMLLDGDDMSRPKKHLLQERGQYLSCPAAAPLAPPIYVGNDSAGSANPTRLHMHTPHNQKFPLSYNRSNEEPDQYVADTPTDLEDLIPEFLTLQGNSSRTVAQLSDEPFERWQNRSDHHDEPFTALPSHFVSLRSRNVRDLSHNIKQRTVLQPKLVNDYPSANPTRQLSKSARDLLFVAQEKARRNLPVHSHPELLHPVPLTSRTSNVLCHTSSDSGSNVAQFNAEPIPTPSQILDEEIWKTWILSPQRALSSETEIVMHDKVSISPGVSNLGYQHFRSESEQTVHRDKTKKPKHRALSVCDCASDQEIEKQKIEDSQDLEDVSRETTLGPRELTFHDDLHRTKPLVDYGNLFQSCPRKTSPPTKPKPAQVKNPDEAWMKFIFGDNDEDEIHNIPRSLFSQNLLQGGPIHFLPASSTKFHPPINKTSTCQPESTMANPTEPRSIELDNTGSLTDTLHVSNHTTQGYNSPSSNGLSQRPSSIDMIRTHFTSPISTPSRPIRKLTFTKPPRFRGPDGYTSPESAVATFGSPIHIGRRFSAAAMVDKVVGSRRGDWVGSSTGKRRWPEHDIYSVGAEDDVESIEDD